MPIQIQAWERRDGADRKVLAEKALAGCRMIKATEGIRSCRFYWYGPDTVVLITEGDLNALNQPIASPEGARLMFEVADIAKQTLNWRLNEPYLGEAQYRSAGRIK